MPGRHPLTRRRFLGGTLGAGLGLLVPRWLQAQAATPAPPPGSGPTRIILDVDPGNDDALAMLLALDAPSLQVEAVTVCPGNMGPNYAQQVRNALFLVDLAGKSGRVISTMP